MALDMVRLLAKHGRPTPRSRRDSLQCWGEFRAEQGMANTTPALLTPPTANAKLALGLANGIFEYGLSLAPAMLSNMYNVCRFATPECSRGCVAYAGHGEMPWVIKARIVKTLFLGQHPDEFYTLLMHELDRVWEKHGVNGRVRLCNFQDIPWEVLWRGLFEDHGRLRFYDYTKWGQRAIDSNLGFYGWPSNYRLTMSASERTTDEEIVHQVNEGINTAVLFDVKKGCPLPSVWKGARVLDGDLHDDRWTDPSYVIVGLRAKGRMKKGNWNMVRKLEAA